MSIKRKTLLSLHDFRVRTTLISAVILFFQFFTSADATAQTFSQRFFMAEACGSLDKYFDPNNRGHLLNIYSPIFVDALEDMNNCIKTVPDKASLTKLYPQVVALFSMMQQTSVPEQAVKEEFAEYLKQARKQSADPEGWLDLAEGFASFGGKLLPQNKEAGCKLLNSSFEKGISWVADFLSICFQEGWGVEANYEKAAQLKKKALELGGPYEFIDQGDQLYAKGRWAEAEKHYRAAISGGADARLQLAKTLMGGEDKEKLQEALNILDTLFLEQNEQSYEFFVEVNLIGQNHNKIKRLFPDHEFKSREVAGLFQNESRADLVCRLSNYFLQNYRFIAEAVQLDDIKTVLEIVKSNTEMESEFRGFCEEALAKYYLAGLLEQKNYPAAFRYLQRAGRHGNQDANLRIAETLIDHRHEMRVHLPLRLAADLADQVLSSGLRIQRANALTILSEIKIIQGDFDEAEKLALEAYNLTRHDFIPGSLWVVTWFELLKIGKENFSQDRLDAYLRKADELGSSELVFQFARNRQGDEKYISYLNRVETDADVSEERGFLYGEKELFEDAFSYFTMCDALTIGGNRDCANSAADAARHLSGAAIEKARLYVDIIVSELRAASAASDVAKSPSALPSSGKSVALIFYASDYESLIGDLKTPAEDAKRLASILEENYGFETSVVANPRRRDIFRHLNDQQALTKEDKLLIFFAGHGKSEGDTTFWLPVDASAEEESMWVEDTTIKRKLSLIPANNILVVADTCFSGNLTRGVEIVTEPPSKALFRKYDETKSRVAITSGGDQPVLDALGGKHSIFAEAFLSFLESQEEPFSASKVVQEIGPAVSKKSLAAGLGQVPRYGALYGQSGHDGPDFVFYPLKKKN